jgi:hypothetical protein
VTTTALLDRPTEARPPASDATTWSSSASARGLLAITLLGAACIHFAMVPSHAGEWFAEGVAFALAGWLQVVLAALLVVRPSKPVLWITVVSNLVFIGAWVWTRWVGPPFGPEAGVAHEIGFVDLTCVVLEALVVLLAVAVLVRPSLGGQIPRWLFAPLAVVPLLVVGGLVTAAIVSPSASNHVHSESADGAGHTHDHGSEALAPHDHPATDAAAVGAPAASEASPHSHGGSATPIASGDDKGLALLSNGEMAHNYGPDQPLDAATRAVLVHQLELTRLVAARFPTLKDAKAAGSKPAGGFGPGMGIHMSTPQGAVPEPPPRDPNLPVIPGTLSDAEIMHPSNLLYDGTTDDAPLAGFMYYAFTPDEPAGFAGPNDHWHTHGSLCIQMTDGKIGVLHPDQQTTEACQALGGFFVERTNWMVHVWTIPGYESSRGVFSDINPAIACPDGTYFIVPEKDSPKYPTNKCRSNPA